MLSISFCTTCRDRLSDLQQTLGANLDQLRADEELVLLDYNCPAGTYDWAVQHHRYAIQVGRLRVYAERTAPRFFMAHAKNISHRLGRGRVLVNLDADNTLDADYLATLRGCDWTRLGILYPFTGSGGFKGRTAASKAHFEQLGGYDEDLCYGYGVEEIDLYLRFRAAKIPHQHVVIDPATAIVTSLKQKAAGQRDPETTIRETEHLHHQISGEKLRTKQLVRNAGRTWGFADLIDANAVMPSSQYAIQ